MKAGTGASLLVAAAALGMTLALSRHGASEPSRAGAAALVDARAAAPAAPAVTGGVAAAHGAHHQHARLPRGLDTARTREFDFDPPAPGSYTLPVVRPAADGAVLDTHGTARRLHDVFDGRIVLLSFIYTRCTDAQGCPLATAVLYKIFGASKADRALADNLRMVSLSFDPAHDTPEIMAGYRNGDSPDWADGAEWLDLTTASDGELKPILTAYDQVVRRRVDDDGKPTDAFGHQLRAYLIDRHKRIRNIYGLGFLDPRLLVADVHTLLAEEQAADR
jgi:cytochrome oxidase Cu insertion factor (SCO1/SenC/PrrC family)